MVNEKQNDREGSRQAAEQQRLVSEQLRVAAEEQRRLQESEREYGTVSMSKRTS